MSPERILEWSVAAVFGAVALMMLAMAGPIAVVVWFIVCLPMWWVLVTLIVSRCWEIQQREWKEREWQWKHEAECWKERGWQWNHEAECWKERGWQWNHEAEYWKEREWQWKREVECWKGRAIRAEGAASLWKAIAGGAGRGNAGSLTALAKASGSRRSLIALLHPDRHGNSRAANSATAYVMKHLPK